MDTRETDARVAREVMGREVETRTHEGTEYLFEFVRDEREGYRSLDRLLPRYSEDMNAVMEMIENVISDLGGTVEIILERNVRWILFKTRSGKRYGQKDPSLQVGACIAALEAMANKEKEQPR